VAAPSIYAMHRQAKPIAAGGGGGAAVAPNECVKLLLAPTITGWQQMLNKCC